MKKIITIAVLAIAINVVALPPTKEQLENAKKIEDWEKKEVEKTLGKDLKIKK